MNGSTAPPSDEGAPKHRAVGAILGVALLAWSAWGAATAFRRAQRLVDIDPWASEAPVSWPRTGRWVSDIESLLVRIDERVPPGSRVAVLPAGEIVPGQGSYLTRWIAYLWPDRDFVHVAPHSRPPASADALLVWGDADSISEWTQIDTEGSLRCLVAKEPRR